MTAIPVSGHELRRTLTVYRPERVDDGAGGAAVAFVEVDDVQAKVSQSSAEERARAGTFAAEHTHIVHMAPGADVERGDELRGAGEVFRVLATRTPSAPVYLRADVQRIESEPGDAGS